MNHLELAKKTVVHSTIHSPINEMLDAQTHALISIAESLELLTREERKNIEDPLITRFEWDESLGKSMPITRRQSVWKRLDGEDK